MEPTDDSGKLLRLPDKNVPRVAKDQARYLPQSVEAETALLGCMFISPEIWEKPAVACTWPRHFYLEANRLIWQTALDLRANGEPVDVITVTDLLAQRQQLDTVGGISGVSALANNVPTSENVEAYARIVQRVARQRLAISCAADLAAAGYSSDGDALLAYWRTMRVELDDELAEAQRETGFYLMSDLEAEELAPARGILGDILYEDTVAFMYGPPGRWKSFVALSWALSIATGRRWLDKETQEGDVVYVAAEGARGIGKRIRAWKRKHGVAGKTRLRVLGVPVQLLQPESVQQLVQVVKAADCNPTLIVIDTLARSMAGGDENAAKDANVAIDAASTIKQAFGCCVLLVHHPGKDAARGLRGSSALLGNADTVISVAGTDDEKKRRLEIGDTILVQSEKPKDSEPFGDIYLTTEKVQWALDDGQFVSSLVIVPTSEPEREEKPRGPSRKQIITLDTLREHPEGLNAAAWQKTAQIAGGLSRSEFFTCLKQWQEQGVVEMGDDGCYTCVPGRHPYQSG